MNKFDIDKISALSRLDIRAEERAQLIRDMEAVVVFSDKVRSSEQYTVNQKTYVSTELRGDEISPSIDREILLSRSPKSENGYISVARTVKKGEDGK